MTNLRPSTKNLSVIPNPENLYKRCAGLCMLNKLQNIIIDYDVDESYFMEGWMEGTKVFVFDNNEGDYLHIAFRENQCFIKGFGHESEMSSWASNKLWNGMLNGFPEIMLDILNDASLMINECTTFLYWWNPNKKVWETGVNLNTFPPDTCLGLADMSEMLLEPFIQDEGAFVDWAENHFTNNDGAPLDVEDLFPKIFNNQPLAVELIKMSAPEITKEQIIELQNLAANINYSK